MAHATSCELLFCCWQSRRVSVLEGRNESRRSDGIRFKCCSPDREVVPSEALTKCFRVLRAPDLWSPIKKLENATAAVGSSLGDKATRSLRVTLYKDAIQATHCKRAQLLNDGEAD